MKRFFYFFISFSVSFASFSGNEIKAETSLDSIVVEKKVSESISAEIQYENKDLKPQFPGFVPFAEVIAFNIFIWSYDRFILQKDYAKISPSIWKRNLREGWRFDDNHFAINFFGHPYQGTYYHVAGRSSGYSFYQSLFFASIGSWTWEYFAETEYPSINDFITTSLGGSLYGEMLFRLSQRLLAKPDPTWFEQVQSFVLHPLSYFHWKAAGSRVYNPGYAPLEMSLALGGGYRFGSDYSYNKTAINEDRVSNEWNEFFGQVSLNLVYGKPNKKVKQPGDYFTVTVSFEQGQEERIFKMNASSKLHNYSRSYEDKAWLDLGLYLDFDTFYGDLAEMGNISIGLGLDIKAPLSDAITLRYLVKPGIIPIGSADFNYDEIVRPNSVSRNDEIARSYQYNFGAKFYTSVLLEFFERYRIINAFDIHVMKTMPNSEPHYGARGYDVVGFNQAYLEAQLTENMCLGVRLDSYFKVAAYMGDDFEPMSRIMHTIGFYNRFLF